ncbi:hypothetical protein [Pseudoalteromonas sp. L1]|uniref:hypothetical protein n=1 Tax=Pseudoalteromonas sp. L1 TaxID=195716 RepID=UPI001F177444|nr:hypothetical protein [Pseudoalteromonas sp. L1]
MLNRDFLLPGIAAGVLAVIFPMYWISIFGNTLEGLGEVLKLDLQSLSFSDAVFVLLGALEIYVYLSLRKALKDMFDVEIVRIMLCILAVLVLSFHATVLCDVFLAVSSETVSAATAETVAGIAMIVSAGSLGLYALVGLITAALLLTKRHGTPALLTVFSVLLLIMCIFQLTVIFAYMNLVLFPVALIVLMIFFIKKPELVEVV